MDDIFGDEGKVKDYILRLERLGILNFGYTRHELVSGEWRVKLRRRVNQYNWRDYETSGLPLEFALERMLETILKEDFPQSRERNLQVVRQAWMELLGMDQEEIDAHNEIEPPEDLDEEINELAAVLKLGQMDR